LLLDLIVSNINNEATVLRNDVKDNKNDTTANFVSITLIGTSPNKDGYGTKVIVHAAQRSHFQKKSMYETIFLQLINACILALGMLSLFT